MNLIEEINKLKKEKNAVILAHYYTPDETQALADYVGDSYYLAKRAKETNADIIIFCGVYFMGESAKILNPDKKVIMLDMRADCPMAHMAKVEVIKKMREKYNDLAVVCYINSTVELKCHSDVCVTSSNAVKIVKSLPNKNIFFIPDKNLGAYVAQFVPEKNIILNDGCCHVHSELHVERLRETMKEHPVAKVVAHPECNADILKHASFIGSTAAIISHVEKSKGREFIVCTEPGVGYEINRRTANDKKFYYICGCCPNMKMNHAEKILTALAKEENIVEIKGEVREKALIPLNKMLELAE